MNVLHFYGLSALLFLLSCPLHNIPVGFASVMKPQSPLSNTHRHLLQASVILISMTMACFNLPLPLFYILLYGILCFAFLGLAGDRAVNWFIINQCMIFFTVLHMLTLGFFAVISGSGPKTILARPDTRLLSMVVTMFILNVTAYVLRLTNAQEKIKLAPQCSEEFNLYIKYTCFALVYLLFDSFSALFKIPYYLMVLFLLGSIFLIFLQTYVFFSHVCEIAQNAYLEEENRRFLLERTMQIEREAILRHEMHVDPLTGAYTRRYVEDNIQALIDTQKMFALVYIDLDCLKKVNDTLGHPAGDEHLKDFVRLLGNYLRKNDIFARIGGDEFCIVLPDCPTETAVERMTAIQTNLASEHHTHNEFPLSFSFGISMSEPGVKMEELITKADQSMYRNKQARRQS